SRSGLHWMRRKSPLIDFASALISIVLPVPGTSSSSTCPLARSAVMRRLISSDLPRMHVSRLARMREIACNSLSVAAFIGFLLLRPASWPGALAVHRPARVRAGDASMVQPAAAGRRPAVSVKTSISKNGGFVYLYLL